MAGRGGPSFLKRQKEQARSARQTAKRAAQQARRDERASGVKPEENLGDPIVPEALDDEAVTETPAEAEAETP